MKQLKLYHYWRSSSSWRVRWALEYKGIAYDSIPVNLLQNEQRSAPYTQKSPMQNVPMLEIDGKALTESLAIMEWIEETYPKPALLPTDAMTRATVRELCQIIASDIQPIQNLKVMQYYSADPKDRERWAKHWISQGLKAVEARLNQTAGTFSVGGELTMADLCLIPQVYNALRFNVDMNQFPLCRRIYDHCLKLPHCDKAAPHNRPGAQP